MPMAAQLKIVRQIERGFPSGHDHVIPNGKSNHKTNIWLPIGHERCPVTHTIATVMIVMTFVTKTICILSSI
jgi:hypothetical protein